MKKFYFSILSFFILFISYAQVPTIEWQNTIGGSDYDDSLGLFQSSDGGYIIGGTSYSDISGDKTENSNGNSDFWMVKLNSSGIIQWQNTIGGNSRDDLKDIKQTIDGGYILGGISYSNISADKSENSYGGSDYWIVKTNSSGQIEWDKTIGGDESDNLISISQTSDGGYILGGYSFSNISGNKTENTNGGNDYWIIKLDALGNIEWQNSIGGSDNDELWNIEQTLDGGYVIGGFSYSNTSGDKTENSIGQSDYWVVKISPIGVVEWENTIGGNLIDSLRDIKETSDGGYILGGSSSSNISGDKTENIIGASDYWIVKLNSLGNIQWQNNIGGFDLDEFFSLSALNDGYILTGYSSSNIGGDKTENSRGGQDFWIIKIDLLGNIIWQDTIGGSELDNPREVISTSDGGFAISGFSLSNISGDKTENSNGSFDIWVLKLESETLSVSTQIKPNKILMYPNPVKDVIELDSTEKITSVNIYSILGAFVKEIKVKNNSLVDVSNLSSGIYLIEINSGDKKIIKKFIKE